MTVRRLPPALLALACVALLAGALTTIATARMQSVKLAPKLCETTGGGRFVSIPGFPGERIDRRLLRDIRWLKRKYSIFITDGFSRDPVHALNGEHPLGLALDVVPNRAKGGTWGDITRLANWAEPRQNRPRAPFRWVGYNGDAGHGRGHHLHLSYDHSPSKPFDPARTIYSVRCPDVVETRSRSGDGDDGGDGGGSGPSGGVSPGTAPVATESGGVSAP